MTRVDFHFNAPDKLHYCSRLLRKVLRTGQRAVVHGEPAARRVMQADWDRPRRVDWVAALKAAIEQAERPVVLVAHTLGVTTVAHAAAAINATDDGPISASSGSENVSTQRVATNIGRRTRTRMLSRPTGLPNCV